MTVKRDSLPGAFYLPRLPPPRVYGFEPEGGNVEWQLFWQGDRFKGTYFDEVVIPDHDLGSFMMLLAKIAHSFAVAEYRAGFLAERFEGRSVEWVLPRYILGKESDIETKVGGFHQHPDNEEAPIKHLHRLGFGTMIRMDEQAGTQTHTHLMVSVRLFNFLDTHDFQVVAGKLL